MIWKKLCPAVIGAICLALSLAMPSGAALAADTAVVTQAAVATATQPTAERPVTVDYKLGSGDKIRVIVFGEDDLGGEYVVDGSGYVRLPLIGQVKAAGFTVHDFENEVVKEFENGQYLKNPRVSIEVTNYRPFYIIGEVNKPGEYPYVNDMTVLNAVALAGGYTYRADQNFVYIRKMGEKKEIQVPANQSTPVHPGDMIRVTERFF